MAEAPTRQTIANSAEWSAFMADEAARAASARRWAELQPKLDEAVRLIEQGFDFDDPWPGVAVSRYGEVCVIDVETWALMRAAVSGVGIAALKEENHG